MKIKLILFIIVSMNFISANPPIKEPDSWKRISEPLHYQQENLWEYINGAADLFLSYGFLELEAHEFKIDTLSFTLDIYDMEKPINAFGIYMAEKGKDVRSLKIGTESVVLPPYQCLYLKDKYYVKINVFEGQVNSELGGNILVELDKQIPGLAEYPNEFKILPEENLVEGSFHYVKETYAGLGELNNCFVAEYTDASNKTYETFLMLYPTEKAAKEYLLGLSEKWNKTSEGDWEFYYRKIPYKGYAGLLLRHNNVFGISGIKDLEQLKQKLKN